MQSNPKDIIAVLKKAKNVIVDPTSWIKKLPASDEFGEECELESAEACRFCMDGALQTQFNLRELRTSGVPQYSDAVRCLNRAAHDRFPSRIEYFESFVWFNDHEDTTHDDVMQVFDDAIKELETNGEVHAGQ